MADWEEVRQVALNLPETSERANSAGVREWRVEDKLFTWERPLRKSDYQALGDAAPDGPILAAWVPDLGAKEALLAEDPEIYFTTPHFDGYAVILARLERLPADHLSELLVEAWLLRAPKRLAKAYLDAHPA